MVSTEGCIEKIKMKYRPGHDLGTSQRFYDFSRRLPMMNDTGLKKLVNSIHYSYSMTLPSGFRATRA